MAWYKFNDSDYLVVRLTRQAHFYIYVAKKTHSIISYFIIYIIIFLNMIFNSHLPFFSMGQAPQDPVVSANNLPTTSKVHKKYNLFITVKRSLDMFLYFS